MHLDNLNAANITNLTSLWKKMGTQPPSIMFINNFHASVSWPHRGWFDWTANIEETPALDDLLFQLQRGCIIPVWRGQLDHSLVLERILTDARFELSFQQTAMYLTLENYRVADHLKPDVVTIRSERDIETWTRVAAQSFNYEIDVSVIQHIADDPDVQLLLAYVDSQPAATALLFRTEDIIGIHQVGVSEQYRGKGVAKSLMLYVIKRCHALAAKHITLQASAAGEPLYRNLGFKQQFMIQNYQRVIGN
ncbi:MAG: GNAT family N-acetyltransferase [Gammaproteobacteria bacterium]|nr:GNAT family N-acetyltransferase [Gammaproteobacteria bacterium]